MLLSKKLLQKNIFAPFFYFILNLIFTLAFSLFFGKHKTYGDFLAIILGTTLIVLYVYSLVFSSYLYNLWLTTNNRSYLNYSYGVSSGFLIFLIIPSFVVSLVILILFSNKIQGEKIASLKSKNLQTRMIFNLAGILILIMMTTLRFIYQEIFTTNLSLLFELTLLVSTGFILKNTFYQFIDLKTKNLRGSFLIITLICTLFGQFGGLKGKKINY